jgi:hypothetical protein
MSLAARLAGLAAVLGIFAWGLAADGLRPGRHAAVAGASGYEGPRGFVVFAAKNATAAPEGDAMFVQAVPGGKAERMTRRSNSPAGLERPRFALTVSADRRSVTIRGVGARPWTQSWRLPAAPVGHGGVPVIPPIILPDPDGKRFVINVPRGVYELDRGAPTPRPYCEPVRRKEDLLLSPNGRSLAARFKIGISLAEGFDNTIFVYNLATGHSLLLDNGSMGAAALTQDRIPLAWSRDSRWLLVREDRDLGLGPGKVWAFNARTGAKTLLWSCSSPVASIAWHEGLPHPERLGLGAGTSWRTDTL